MEDHLDSIAAIVSEGQQAGYSTGRVNVGPLTEFSSKVVHLIQAHHDSGRLRPALCQLLSGGGGGNGNSGAAASAGSQAAGEALASSSVWREKARAPRKGGGLMGERVPASAVAGTGVAAAAVCDLHFWVWGAAGVSTASALPSTEAARASDNPKLPQDARQQAWVLANAALAAVGKSHGAYDRKEGVATCRISIVLVRETTFGASFDWKPEHLICQDRLGTTIGKVEGEKACSAGGWCCDPGGIACAAVRRSARLGGADRASHVGGDP